MSYLLLSAGILLFAFIVLDIIKTALSTQGGGMLTKALSRTVWGLFFLASGRRGDAPLLRYCGQAILVTIIGCWIIGLWLGLFMIFWSVPGSVINGTTRAPADIWETFYFTGFALSTLGVGDFQAAADGWRVLTSAAAFSGLVLITTAITYFVPVLSAVTLQKQLSLYISAMGRSPQQILLNCWTGQDFAPFFSSASTLSQMIMKHTMDHHAYPVVRYFHITDPALNVVPALVMLDETRQLLAEAMEGLERSHQQQLQTLETALDAYLEMVLKHFIRADQPREPVPLPDLESLRTAGLPVHPAGVERLTAPAVAEHRRLLGVMLEQGGWRWAQVYKD